MTTQDNNIANGPTGSGPATTVFVADDHAVVRSGLKMLLEAEAGFRVVGEAGDIPVTASAIASLNPDVLVLDLNMPGEPSLDAIPRLREISPQTQIVVLTMQGDPAFARKALQSGAVGYVLKESAGSELVQAVHMAKGGQVYLTPQLGARLATESSQSLGPPDDLTEREIEVLRLIALGHTNAEVGQQLYLSVRTIEAHRAHIQQKIGRSSRAELVRYAIDHDLIGL